MGDAWAICLARRLSSIVLLQCSILVRSSTESFNLILLRWDRCEKPRASASPLPSQSVRFFYTKNTTPIVQCGRRSMPDPSSSVNLNGRGFCRPASASLKNHALLQGCTRRTSSRPLPGTSSPESVRMNRRDACSQHTHKSALTWAWATGASLTNLASAATCLHVRRAEIWNPTRESRCHVSAREEDVAEWVLRHRRSTPYNNMTDPHAGPLPGTPDLFPACS